MSSGYLVKKKFRLISRGVIVTTVLAMAVASYMAYSLASDRAYSRVAAAARESLALQAETLNGLLEKYRLLPPLLAKRDDIRALFVEPDSPATRKAAVEKAIEITGLSGAGDVIFADREGRVFASARGRFDDDVINQTALFEAAKQGRLGRQTTATNGGERSYAFATAIRENGQLSGVIAVYVLFDTIEATWSLTGKPIAATDRLGTVFLSNRLNWHQRRLLRTKEQDEAILYPVGDPSSRPHLSDGSNLYVQARQSLPLLEWDLHVFEGYGPVIREGRNAALATGTIFLLLGLLAWIMVKRRENLVARMRLDQATALRLERLVRDRTFELTEVNETLEKEVVERRRTEKQLRDTQEELIQAAKLAALGQMSATLSHEFNQPLAAIATQADNARRLIEKDRIGTAVDALGRISGLVQRMSELSKTLLTFARKPGTALTPIEPALALDEALVLVAPKLRKSGTVVDRKRMGKDCAVMAGRIRLTQVMINLINNAMDAMEAAGQGDKRIEVSTQRNEASVLIVVEDNGPGISQEMRDRVFDPFFTTKDVGEGLGIGLSVVFNIIKDFGGTIRVAESANGGARFEITLASAEKENAENSTETVAAE